MSYFAILDGAVPKFLFVLLNLYLGFKLGQRSASPNSNDSDSDKETNVPTRLHASKEKSGQCDSVVSSNKPEEPLDDEVGDIADGDLLMIRAGFTEQCKMVLVVRTDLRMDIATIASLCSKATLACYKALSARNPQLVKHWERTGQAKIALKGKNDEQLLELEAIAKSLNLCARSVHAKGPSKQGSDENAHERAVLAIGPAPVQIVNEVTGSLRLL